MESLYHVKGSTRQEMNNEPRHIRVLMVKPGIDGHWRGAMVVSMALRDAGMEVIYGGNLTPEAIVKTAIQEDVDVIGLSIYSAGYLQLISDVLNTLQANKAEDLLVIVGGTIPPQDIPLLKQAGVDEVFLPGSPVEKIVDYIKTNVNRKNATSLPRTGGAPRGEASASCPKPQGGLLS
jgi:methylmalonyl-CoA mutase C-terminal domain/subunit